MNILPNCYLTEEIFFKVWKISDKKVLYLKI
jgi:hypothetical protein